MIKGGIRGTIIDLVGDVETLMDLVSGNRDFTYTYKEIIKKSSLKGNYKKGEDIRLFYDPYNPNKFIIENEGMLMGRFLALISGIVFLGLSIYILIRFWPK